MKEEKILVVGGVNLMLQKITQKEWRTISPNDSRYLGYFSPDYPRGKYYKFPKKENLPKILKQIKLYCDQNFTFETENFIKKISFIPCYIYNNLLFFTDKEIPRDILDWRNDLKNILEKKDPSLLSFPTDELKHIFIDRGQERVGALEGKGIAFLNYWNLEIVAGRAKVGLCFLSGCNRIFIESRRKIQKYCSEYCRNKSYYDRAIRKKKL